MRKLFILLAVCLGTSTFNQTNAQISIDGMVKFQGMATVGAMSGIGLRGEYHLQDRLGIRAGFDYFFGKSTDYVASGSAFSSVTSPSYIDVNYTESYSIINVAVGGKYYFVGDYEEDFGFYGLVDVGILLAPVKYEYEAYNASLYDVYEGENTMLFNFSIGGGVGVEYKVGPGSVFGDVYLTVPANQVDGLVVEVQVPPAAGLSLGYRLPINL